MRVMRPTDSKAVVRTVVDIFRVRGSAKKWISCVCLRVGEKRRVSCRAKKFELLKIADAIVGARPNEVRWRQDCGARSLAED
jgi:hypothetical protein